MTAPTVDRRTRDGLVVGLGVAGSVLLGLAFAQPSGSRGFALLVLGAVVAWVGAALAGRPLPVGRRTVGEPLAVAVLLFGAFAVGALVVRSVPALQRGVGDVLAFADDGGVLVGLALALVGGTAEEPLFRGALWDVVARRTRLSPAVVTTALYVLMVGATSQNLALTLAAAALSATAAWQRVRAGGLLAPVVVHATWSTLMVLLLPR